MDCILKTFFVLLLFSFVSLSLGNEVLDKINALEERVHNLEMTNIELVTSVQACNTKLGEAQEQLNVSTSANNLVKQKVEALDEQLGDLEEFTNLLPIPESCGKLSLLGITKSMESLIDPDGKGENNAPIKVSNFRYDTYFDIFSKQADLSRKVVLIQFEFSMITKVRSF